MSRLLCLGLLHASAAIKSTLVRPGYKTLSASVSYSGVANKDVVAELSRELRLARAAAIFTDDLASCR
eukprot:CAMPEP_0119271198 /NCGR_PEP_ID=MMETSP1329-20130426/7886_1 /TAXON_ID=114041 /ORGANISM="Genus nov. species nov., Strain RCC1024" /LENGTH=67 /DNA_ID=CAMNT_0007271241 /DNA_START=98 /DNA_END=297 /DNA_ORIENTATION=-